MTNPTDNSTLTATELQDLLDDAVKAKRKASTSAEELKRISGLLIGVASERPWEHRATDGGGVSWELKASDGSLVRVTFPADGLKDKIDPTTKEGQKLIARFVDGAGNAARKLKKYFTRRVVYSPLEDFRARVENDFPPKKAESLIASCEKDSAPTVGFELVKKAMV